MTNAVRVSEDLVKEAKIFSKVDKRSVTGQIEHCNMGTFLGILITILQQFQGVAGRATGSTCIHD